MPNTKPTNLAYVMGLDFFLIAASVAWLMTPEPDVLKHAPYLQRGHAQVGDRGTWGKDALKTPEQLHSEYAIAKSWLAETDFHRWFGMPPEVMPGVKSVLNVLNSDWSQRPIKQYEIFTTTPKLRVIWTQNSLTITELE